MLKKTFLKIRFNFALTAATVGVIAGILGTVIGTGVTLALANNSEASLAYSFSNNDNDDYVTIDPTSGTIKYNLLQNTVSNGYKKTKVEYKVGYKATFQSKYTNKTVYLTGDDTSSGYNKLEKQYGVRDYKIKLARITNVDKTTGVLKLKVT